MEENKVEIKIPEYYFDKTFSEEEKKKLDWEIIAKDFPHLLTNPKE